MATIEQDEEERRYQEAAKEERRALERRLLEDPIRVLQPKTVATVAPDETVAHVVGRLAGAPQGCVVVLEGGQVAGILTERDVVRRIVAPGRDPAATAVGDVMTPDPEVLYVDDTLGFALHKMSLGGYRHLPVVDAAGRLLGMITQDDGMRYLVGFFPDAVINQPPRSIQQKPPRSRHGG
jgi:CBS domain-containing protein